MLLDLCTVGIGTCICLSLCHIYYFYISYNLKITIIVNKFVFYMNN